MKKGEQPGVGGAGTCRSGFSRELLPWPLPLRRQGEAGRGWPRFGLIQKAPLPSPPLPSQEREQELAAEAAPANSIDQSFDFFSAPPLCTATWSVLSLLISYCGSSSDRKSVV